MIRSKLSVDHVLSTLTGLLPEGLHACSEWPKVPAVTSGHMHGPQVSCS